MESIGNTWGWDNGNWPQLDALLHVLLPFSFTEGIANQLQTFAQAEFIDGAHIGCEFECSNPLGYLGGWLHGQTSLASLLSGFTFPETLTDTIGQDVNGIVNVGDNPLGGDLAIWSGASGQLNPLAALEGIAGSLTASPADNPILTQG